MILSEVRRPSGLQNSLYRELIAKYTIAVLCNVLFFYLAPITGYIGAEPPYDAQVQRIRERVSSSSHMPVYVQ